MKFTHSPVGRIFDFRFLDIMNEAAIFTHRLLCENVFLHMDKYLGMGLLCHVGYL